jgi:hypothetical protein
MAGRGPASTGRAIRRNKEQQAHGVVFASPSEQPKLPDVYRMVTVYDERLEEWVEKRVKMTWSPQTRRWWDTWAKSPLSTDFTEDDWTFLTDTALLHHAYWTGDTKVAGELRLRVAKFGQTPEDRARLKIQFAPPPEEGQEEAPKTGASARARRGALRVV